MPASTSPNPLTVNELITVLQEAVTNGVLTGDEQLTSEGMLCDILYKSTWEGNRFVGLASAAHGSSFYEIPQFSVLWEQRPEPAPELADPWI